MSFIKLFNRKLTLKLKFRTVRVRRRRKKTLASQKHYSEHKLRTRVLVEERIEYFKEQYRVKHGIDLIPSGRIAIRNTVSRWGSCSIKGNLNFSYRLSLLPVHLSDYIIVHELCHLKEFNHGQGFWNLVELESPEYKSHREELKKIPLRM